MTRRTNKATILAGLTLMGLALAEDPPETLIRPG